MRISSRQALPLPALVKHAASHPTVHSDNPTDTLTLNASKILFGDDKHRKEEPEDPREKLYKAIVEAYGGPVALVRPYTILPGENIQQAAKRIAAEQRRIAEEQGDGGGRHVKKKPEQDSK